MMDQRRKVLIETFQFREQDIRHLISSNNATFYAKDAGYSTKYRNAGNEIFKQRVHTTRDHENIFRHYCLSVVFAPIDSKELMLAYGNRSAFLLHIKKYRDSINDIERAFSLSDSIAYKIRLLCRKTECLAKLGSVPECKRVLMQAKILMDVYEDQENKKDLEGLIGSVQGMCDKAKKRDQSIVQKKDDIEVDATTDIASRVSVIQNSEYGWGLVAARDYEPGEVIFIEKLFASVPDLRFSHKYCHHCMAYCWSGIPCNNCFVVLFCSEHCREEALKAYHEIECPVEAELINNGLRDHKYFLSVRLLMIGLQEVDSLYQLKTTLQYMDEKADKCSFAMKNNAENNTKFVSIYDTPGESQFSKHELAFYAIYCLIFIGKKTKIFKDYVFRGFEAFSKCEDVLYIGSLLIRIIEIVEANGRYIYDLMHSHCDRGDWCCRRGSYISPLTSLIHQSCFPNTSRCFIKNKKITIFALHPIKKDDMLFDCHGSPFYWQCRWDRFARLQWIHMTCKCQACAEDWPPLLLLHHQREEEPETIAIGGEDNSIKENRQILLNCGLDNYKYVSKRMSKLSETIKSTFNNSSPPSLITCMLVYGMQCSFLSKYGLKVQNPFEEPCS